VTLAWLGRIALALALAAAVALALSGPGTRLALWNYPVGFMLLRGAAYIGIAAALLAIAALAIPRARAGRVSTLLFALILGGVAAALPFAFQAGARSVPPIHDISTDTVHPPQFFAVLPLRAAAPNPPGYAGASVAELQRKHYPDIRTLELPNPPAAAFRRALAAAQDMGWQIVASDVTLGRIEAVATTPWFGFKDDIVILVRGAPSGSIVDMRSKSRVGRSDLGANARRIRAYFERLK
jgi:hypothetical protein